MFTEVRKGFIYILVFLQCFPVLLSNNYANEANAEFIVVLDAGHGGKDPGAVGKKAKEKEITLAITLKAGEYIEKNLKDVKVLYTRKKDVFVEFDKRADVANKNQAHLFVSIHVNAFTNPNPYGTSSYVLGLHRADESFEVAKRENSVMLLEEDYENKYMGYDPNSEESFIIFSAMQNIYDKQSVEFAAMMQDQFRERAGRKDRGVHRQGLIVLALTGMPGVLVETGYISNPNEENYLMSKQGQDYIASAIFRAVREYRNSIESKSNFETAKPDPIESVAATTSEENVQVEKVEEPEVTVSAVTTKKEKEVSKPIPNQKPEKDLIQNKQLIPYYIYNDSSVIYHVQVSSSYAHLEAGTPFFENINDVYVYKTDDLYKYIVGGEMSYDKIKVLLNEVKSDFPDAFVIAVKNGKLIPLHQAFRESGLKNDIIN